LTPNAKQLLRIQAIKRTFTELEENTGKAVLLVRNGLDSAQAEDPELGPAVRMRINSAQKPFSDEILFESKLTKRMWNQWKKLKVHESFVY